jgi:hypothetical protein
MPLIEDAKKRITSKFKLFRDSKVCGREKSI